MKSSLKQYNPQQTEDAWYRYWSENSLFAAHPNSSKEPFTIVIPPPNVTGILHMGHALNNTIQDILIRYHRMKQKECLWMPGTDHAGIATQNVVEKTIAKEGIKRQDLGREKFIERVWQWKEEYGSTIIRQLKKLGSSCDWSRIRFTMDQEYSETVKYVFIALWNKGLIYRDNKVINWCPRCQTALSDEEAPHHQVEGHLYYLRYPLNDDPSHYLVVATTRPETMLGDTAVAVNPKDKRYKKLIGATILLPLMNREIKIIADPMVDMKFGTGAVKVTPAHDPNDYVLGKKHFLEFINVMHPDARMNESAGKYQNMDRFQAREVILEDLKEKQLLERTEAHVLSAGHCYRCHTIIEPYLSWQWFVKMKPLAKPAIEAVKKGKIKFYPRRWTKVYLNWMENIQDWCISRQIWWGHRIPLWYCFDCKKEVFASATQPDACRACGSKNLIQDENVLDTWFSSWLWPFATFYWPKLKEKSPRGTLPEEDLKYFYPTHVLVTAPEIIFFWVARMIMAGLEFMGDIPFRDVYIHGTVRDIEGKKMSKSLGNVINPLEIINEYGACALRFSLISITSQGQDVYLSKERFEQGRNFANKIWNASRFIITHLNRCVISTDLCVFFQKEQLSLANRWILSRFYSLLKAVEKNLAQYRFNEAANLLYGFFWHEFCDWYLEIIKPDIADRQNQIVMYKVLEKFLRILHPYMPFVTEEIWQKLCVPAAPSQEPLSIMTQTWPHIQEQIIDKKVEKQAENLFAIISQIRNMRANLEIPLENSVTVSLFPHTKTHAMLVVQNKRILQTLAKISSLMILEKNQKPSATLSAVTKGIDLYLHFGGIIDIAKEKGKIETKIAQVKKSISSKEQRLKNHDFLKKAPKEVVEKETESKRTLEDELKRLETIKEDIAGT
ncbi:MAG: valine--tRNA ligase [Candidatus Omnitrophica bacterium]|nr:valine--tRNA ligase [Candidatus Omnitrophota bacterium]